MDWARVGTSQSENIKQSDGQTCSKRFQLQLNLPPSLAWWVSELPQYPSHWLCHGALSRVCDNFACQKSLGAQWIIAPNSQEVLAAYHCSNACACPIVDPFVTWTLCLAADGQFAKKAAAFCIDGSVFACGLARVFHAQWHHLQVAIEQATKSHPANRALRVCEAWHVTNLSADCCCICKLFSNT